MSETMAQPASPAKTFFVGTPAFLAAPPTFVAQTNAQNQAFTDGVTAGDIIFTPGKTVAYALQQRIAELDMLLSASVSGVLHDPRFQTLEASWRGLQGLVMNTDTSEMLKLRVLSATSDELYKDLSGAIDHDQSALFKKLYEEEYGTFGGNPYGVLLYDYEFGRDDVDFAKLLSGVAAAAHAPLIAAAAPGLFDRDWTDFTRLGVPRDLSKIFDSIDMQPWADLRNSDDSRYLSLVMPRVLMRLPYGSETDTVTGMTPVDGMDFAELLTEPSTGMQHSDYLWGNAVWALGGLITSAFSQFQWCAAIRGKEGGGLVSDLPLHTFTTPAGDVTAKVPTEVAITDRREKELNDLGFIALCYEKGTTDACFFGGATVQKPQVYTNPAANANAQASALLPYILTASRFAHYIKKIVREKVGSFQTRGELETFLNNWIADYVLINDDASQTSKASYPLRAARVDVTEVTGSVGSYNATVFLQPHFQLEELTASIRLVASLPAPPSSS
jgi:type VI secretion system protein ImpC